MKFLLMTINQRVVGSNPAFPPKNTRLQDGYFLLYFIKSIKKVKDEKDIQETGFKRFDRR